MRLRWILVSIAVIAAASGIVIGIRAHRTKPVPVVAPPAPAAPGELNLTGRVQPRNIVNAAAPVAGVIDALFLDVGQDVYKDQLLGRIRNPDSDASIDQAQTRLDQAQARVASLNGDQLAAKLEVSRAEADESRAKSDVDRLRKNYETQKGLWDIGATPRLTFEKAQKDFDDAQKLAGAFEVSATTAREGVEKIVADLDAANRAVADATSALERAKAEQNVGEIHSPADGLVVARHGAPGEMVEKGATVFEVATDLTQLQVIVPAASAQIRAGQAASIHVPELSADEIAGTVREVRGDQAVIDFTSPVAASKLDLTAQVKIKF